jgi:enoyl-CoA hydratase
MENDRCTMPNGTIFLEGAGAVTRLVLDQPDTGNPLNPSCMEDFETAIGIIRADADTRVVILKGNGRSLSAGGDLRTMTEYLEMDQQADRAQIARMGDFFYRNMWRFPKPIVLQVHGYAIGGGMSFVASADVVVADEDAVFGLPEARTWGFNGFIGLWALTLGPLWTKLLLFTGDSIDGRTAERLGLVTKAVPGDELESYVEWLAARIANVDGQVLSIQKQAVNTMMSIVGFETMFDSGQLFAHLQHTHPVGRDFMRRLVEDGPRETIRARDEPFGGPQRRGSRLPLVDGPSRAVGAPEQTSDAPE